MVWYGYLMKIKRKVKRKFTFGILVLLIVVIGLVIGSTKLIRVSVNSEAMGTEVLPTNLKDTTSTEKISLLEIKNDPSKNVILFTSSWCGSCEKLTQDLNLLAIEYPEMNIYIMDLEEDRETANQLEVPVTPTLVLLENGETKNYSEISIDNLSEVVSDFNRLGIR